MIIPLLAVGAALAADRATSTTPERMGALPKPPDLRGAIESARVAGPVGLRDLRMLRRILHAPLGTRLAAAWPEQSLLPKAGYTTRFDPIVPWLLREISKGARIDTGLPGVDMPLDVGEVLDWAAATDPDLDRFNWAQAKHEARLWHQDLTRGHTVGTPVMPAPALATWADGARIERLVTGERLDAEGLSMGHCLRRTLHYWDDARDGEIALLSYRNPRGVPTVTVEIRLTDARPWVVQFQGPGNGPIHDADTRDRMAWWLVRHLGLEVGPFPIPSWRARWERWEHPVMEIGPYPEMGPEPEAESDPGGFPRYPLDDPAFFPNLEPDEDIRDLELGNFPGYRPPTGPVGLEARWAMRMGLDGDRDAVLARGATGLLSAMDPADALLPHTFFVSRHGIGA